MDNNNFENGFVNSQPEKPFTDKTNPNTPIPENFGQNNNDIEFQYQQPVNPNYSQPNYGNQNYKVNQNYYSNQQPSQNDYSHPVYRNMSHPNQTYAPNPMPPQGYSRPPYGQPAPQYFHNNAPKSYSQPPVASAKQKTNAGIIAIIVTLTILLVFSVVGMVIYVLSDDSDKNTNDNSYHFTIPTYSSESPKEEATTTPVINHEDTDYSDKINSDYSGIKLESKPKDSSDKSKYTAESVFNKVSDSVVGIVCYAGEIDNVEHCDSQGSGIIVTSDGYVVTNAHVINNSKTAYKIQVVTSDGNTYNAGVVGFDSRTDIAVLKMDNAKNLQAATFGNSDEIVLGEDIIAVGNPGGLDYQNSMTKGIVSAVARKLSSTSLVKYIQTDAAINPGNSGGPIVNIYGQVIGIATAKIVSEQYEGMGFAIPSVTAKEIIDDLIKKGYVDGRVKIGISGYEVTSAVAQYYNISQGVCVSEITENGPCDNSSLKINDIIIGLDGKKVTSFADIYEILENHKDGDTVKIEFYRYSDTKNYTDEITLQADK